MTKSKLFHGVMMLSALGLGACSDDASGPKGNGQAEDEVIRYIRVAIANPSSSATRAEFDKGTEAENAVSTMYLRFFDINGEPVAISSQTDVTFTDATPEQGAPSVGKIKELVAQFSLAKGQNYPTYVQCSINPVSFGEISEAATINLDEMRNLTRIGYSTGDGLFSMSNATYYGENPITGASNVKIMAAPILASQIFKSKEEAMADDANVVNIYVERYAAKVQFTLNDEVGSGPNGIQPYVLPEDKNYALTFKPEAWTINADEVSTYILKRFDPTNSADYVPSYEEVVEMLGGWTTWNDPNLHRSYWACSPTYYSEDFPRVSDDIVDQARVITNGTTTISEVPGSQLGAGVPIGDYKLRYFSYNQITRPELKSTGLGVTKWKAEVEQGNNIILPAKYALENTMGLRAFNSINPKASAPSVLLVGNYSITNNGAAVNSPDGFCIYGGKLCFNNLANTTGAPAGAKSVVDAFLSQNQILSNAGGAYLKPENLQNGQKDMFEVVHPAQSVRGEQAIPHRYVTLQIKSTATINQLKTLYYKPAGYSNVVQVNPTDEKSRVDIINQLNLLLLQQLGTGQMFNQNKGYFSIPIQHLGITENTATPSPIEEDGSVNWKLARRGDFGLVRNHVYTINVDGINGLATGIDNFDTPLVPPMETDNYWVNYQIKILDWRIVPTQSGIILK